MTTAPTRLSAATERSSRTHGVAILGAGAIAHRHIRTLAASPRVSALRLCDPRLEPARALAAEHNATVTDDPSQVFADPAIDVVYVCTPNHLHDKLALEALEAGKHVLVEKPLAVTADRARRVAKVAQDAGLVLAVGHHYRLLPAYQLARRWLQEGRIGSLRMVIDRISGDYRPHERAEWFMQRETCGGGVLMNNGIHQLDRVCWLLDSMPDACTATWGHHFERGDVESDMTATLTMTGGVQAMLIQTGYRGQLVNGIELIGTRGQIVVDLRQTIRLFEDAQPTECHEMLDSTQGSAVLLDSILDAIESGGAPVIDASWGVSMVELVEQVYVSAQTGTPVQL